MFAVEKSEGDQKPVRRLVSIKDAATQLGVSRATIYNMKAAGSINVAKLLGKAVIAQSEVDRIIASAERGEAI